jgi:DNA-binding Xre family transcriptional regulator
MAPSSTRTAFGTSIRAARIARGWTQRELADQAGLPQAVVWAVEVGDGALVGSLERICSALDGELRLEARLPYSGPGPRQVDRGHARCIGAARRVLEASGYTCATEQQVADGPWLGSIDLLGFDAIARRLVLVEIKTELRDAGALERQVERYVRLCLDVARRLGWQPRELVVVVLVLATAETDAFLVANREVMAGAFPVRGREAIAALLDGATIRGRALLMIDPLRRGRSALRRARVDGRRTPAPYRDYAAFVAALDGNRGGGGGPRGGGGQRAGGRRRAPRGRRALLSGRSS